MSNVMIWGGTRGLGRELAHLSLERGHNTTVTGRSRPGDLKEHLSFIKADFSTWPPNLEQARWMLDVVHRCKDVDTLFWVAGHWLHKPLSECSTQELQLLYNVHLVVPTMLVTSRLSTRASSRLALLSWRGFLLGVSYVGHSMTPELTLAIDAAKEAGAYLLSVFGSSQDVHYKSDSSPVTEADITSSRIINDRLTAAFPDHVILCEESPDALTSEVGSEPTWIIDPLDGTSNFVAGIPLFAVVIAFVNEGRTRIGVMYDPLHDDLFVAETGKGASLNGQPMHVSKREQVRGAMLFAGRGYRERDRERHGQIIYALEQQTTYFRRLGSAAIMLASVAAGRADSVILTGNKPWDVVAGALLIQEAGGYVTDYCGESWTLESEDLVATNGSIHDQIIDITHKQDLGSCV